MSSRFKSWSKIIISTLLILCFYAPLKAQDGKLLPELDVNNGLNSNAVRCIKLDAENRAWVGTDNGLNIVNAQTDVQKNIITAIGSKSIWAINMLDSLVFIGTRNDGLYVFNQFTGNLYKYYPTEGINLIRKIKIFNRAVFLLTNNGPYKWTNAGLYKIPFKSNTPESFAIDMFEWENKLYALPYPFGNARKFISYSNNAFESIVDLLPKKWEDKHSIDYFLCATVFKGQLILGGMANIVVLYADKQKPVQAYYLKNGLDRWVFPVWDIAVANKKIIAVTGNTRTNNTGMLYTLNADYSILKLKETDYIQCVALDTLNNSLYYGSLNNGLYIHKGIENTNIVERPENSHLIANKSSSYFYNKNEIQQTGYPEGNTKQFIVEKSKKEAINGVATLFGDTLVYSSRNYIKIWKSNRLNQHFLSNLYNNPFALQRLNDYLFVFNSYGNICKINLHTNKETIQNDIISFLPYPQLFGDKIVLLNKEKGFFIIKENESYPLNCTNKTIPFVTDFTVIKDTLYTLNRNELNCYWIDTGKQQLNLMQSFAIDSIVEGFRPKWLLTNNSKLYLGNDNGILGFRPSLGKPISYYYLGNYQQLEKPIPLGDSLVFAAGDYLTKLSFEDIDDPNRNVHQKNLAINCPEAVNENLGFNITISYSDYILQNRGLKQLDIWKEGKFTSSKYSINQQISFNSGLQYGDYEFVLGMGKASVKSLMSITLPLNRNPYFFGVVIFFILLVLGVFIKGIYDKKQYQKKLMQNRLQILKQNLNPHFIFNSMNLISSLILEEKYEQAVEVVSEFSNLQRTYLETNNKESITLQEELNFLNAYLKLQQTRFHLDNNFTFTNEIGFDIDTSLITIPPLILQPLAENAIKHGIIGSKAKDKKIIVDVKGKNPVVIGIEDNGDSVEKSTIGFGMGHQLVMERINLYKKQKNVEIKVIFGKAPLHGSSGYRVEVEIYQ